MSEQTDQPVCGAKKKQGEGHCTQPAGWGTQNAPRPAADGRPAFPGVGRCKLHGGATPIKHGRFSSIQRERLKDLIAEFAGDPEPLNLLPELALLRAIVVDLVERWDEIYGPDGALLAWHASFLRDGLGSDKPRQLPDFASISGVVGQIGGMVDRIQRHKASGVVTLATMKRVMEQLGQEIVAATKDAELNETQAAELLNAVERRWGSIRLDAPDAGA